MTLHADYDPENIFAKILRGDMPCVKIHEDDIALSFMDIFPQAEGHTLVIPKAVKARNFLDMPTEKLMASSSLSLMAHLRGKLFSIFTSTSSRAGRTKR